MPTIITRGAVSAKAYGFGVSGGYSVSKSLRFRSSASAYLNRTQGTPTNGYIWTWSGWVKRGTLSSTQMLFSAGASTYEGIQILGTDALEIFRWNGSAYTFQIDTTQVFRDPSAWYHIVVAVDGTQATAANRVKLYINGAQVTAFSTASYPAQNTQYEINQNATAAYTSRAPSAAQYFDGYQAETNFIDGQALTPSSFGAYDTNGVWQPAKYSGTYGTNGFYLTFGNTTSTATLGNDSSGNSNTWTVNNISLTAGTTYDSMTDSPTVTSASVANYCTLNSAANQSGITLSNANLSYNLTNATNGALGTFPMSSGKWYWEVTIGSSNGNWNIVGICNTSLGVQPPVQYYTTSAGRGYFGNTGNKVGAGTNASYGATFTAGDIIGVAFDASAGSLTFYKNGVSQGVAFSGLTTNAAWVPLQDSSIAASTTGDVNFGQRPFTYTAPTGFNALNTYNLATPTIANGAQYMAATTYTGTGASLTIANSANNTIGTTFQPDFVWMKGRSGATDHALYDVVRGTTKDLASNTTAAETTQATGLTAFGSTGFTIGALAKINTSAATYVGWQWLAGNSSGSSNTNGSITSTVSANTTAGFSVVTYTGNATAGATVGHGLGVAPSMVIARYRAGVGSWAVYHSALGATNWLTLNGTNATTVSAQEWNNTNPTSSVFTVGNASSNSNQSGNNVAYCWAAVAGYSAFGSYTGNGSTDGPFVYTGFRPRWILIKNANTANGWGILDTSRPSFPATNVESYILAPNASDAETSYLQWQVDILSNGFKLRYSSAESNGSGNTLIYAAFAENPLNYSRAR